MRALRLDHAGLEFLTPDPALTSLGPDGRTLVFHRDPVLTAGIDSPRVAGGCGAVARLPAHDPAHRESHRRVDQQTPPSIDDMRTRDWWPLVSSGRTRARARPAGPVAPHAVAADGRRRSPSRNGSRAICCKRRCRRAGGLRQLRRAEVGGHGRHAAAAAGGGCRAGRAAASRAKGGPGRVSRPRSEDRVERRGAQIVTGARVTRDRHRDGRASGVVLHNGEAIRGARRRRGDRSAARRSSNSWTGGAAARRSSSA